jgi:hypothetical protein
MHRSGTSCLARILHEAGVFLGDELRLAPQASNLAGHWEADDAVAINDRLLAASGGAWDRPPAEVRADAGTDAAMRAFVAALARHPHAGWKDPRTTLTFPLWRPHLGDVWVLAAFRHPHAVARSLAARGDAPFERGLALWRAYNERLIAIADAEKHVSWFPYGVSLAEYGRRLEAFCAAAGLRWEPRLLALVNPALEHHGAEPIDDPAIARLYEELRRRADVGFEPPRAEGDADALRAQVRALEAGLDGAHEALRGTSLALQAVESRNRELGEQVEALRRRLDELGPVAKWLARLRRLTGRG